MGLLVDGVWQDDKERTKNGHFIRPDAHFRNWVTRGRRAGPWAKPASRLSRAATISMFLSPALGPRAPSFSASSRSSRTSSRCPIVSWHMGTRRLGLRQEQGFDAATTSTAKRKLSEIYVAAAPRYTGRVSVPVLWDKKRKTIVNNESPEIIRMLNSAFDAFTNVKTDYYPKALRAEIDRINDLVYPNINNGVYRAGFATTQEAYEEAFRKLFDALDEIEQILSKQRYRRRRRTHRSRLAAVLHADPFRRRLLQPLQVQLAAHLRIPEPVELSARALSGAGRSPRP